MQNIPDNLITVEIESNGTMLDCTAQVPLPVKFNNLLDEQLDEASISVLRSNTQIFQPLTRVNISFANADNPDDITTLAFVVAGDEVKEVPIGSGKYDHSLYLIEETKCLEGFVCRSQGYVNSLGRIYVDI